MTTRRHCTPGPKKQTRRAGGTARNVRTTALANGASMPNASPQNDPGSPPARCVVCNKAVPEKERTVFLGEVFCAHDQHIARKMAGSANDFVGSVLGSMGIGPEETARIGQAFHGLREVWGALQPGSVAAPAPTGKERP